MRLMDLQDRRRAPRIVARRPRGLYRRGACRRCQRSPGLSQRRARSAAALYDFQARPENLQRMTFMPPGGERRVNCCWQMPRNFDELVRRRQALVGWAEQSGGFVGRSPDHVASSLLGQVIGIEVFRRHGEARARRCSTISTMSAATISS
jgi:aromatic ring hydroxylase